ncbi:MAG: non-hydrolyzing UDP-N-acetylglucosamine 2-epimerase [bacterium]
MRVMLILGTRPEAVKLAPVISILREKADIFETGVVITAQHREILDQILDIFAIQPDYDLNIMTKNQSLTRVAARCLQGLDKIIKKEKPDIVLVQGDTTTVFIAGLVCYYNKVRVGHVEAGLRTKDRFSPFPEEMNRRLLSSLADLHFAPTEWAKENLLREGIPETKVFVTGNTVVDSLQTILARPNNVPVIPPNIGDFIRSRSKIILVTAHRRESFGHPFEEMCRAMLDIADRNPDLGIIYPVHPNPNVRSKVFAILKESPRILLTEPMDYLSFVYLMKSAYIILTDSGGIQEEAPTLGKPVLIMREKTERPEGIEAGISRLVGTKRERIVSEVQLLLDSGTDYEKMVGKKNPFGDGKASQRIADILIDYYGNNKLI